jgi:hypothetical protein
VLVGQDGSWGDHFAEATDVARAACEKAGVSVENQWERELMEQMRPSNDLWRSMGRRAWPVDCSRPYSEVFSHFR